jgi:hypothetical protein
MNTNLYKTKPVVHQTRTSTVIPSFTALVWYPEDSDQQSNLVRAPVPPG